MEIPIGLLTQLAINGVLLGGIYGLAALGLSLIWGVMRVVNVAQGDLLMISAFATYWLFTLTGLHPLVSVAITLPLGFLLGATIYKLLVDRLVERAEHDLMSLVLMVGVSAIIYGFANYMWGADIRSIPILMPTLSVGATTIPWSRLSAFLFSLAFVGFTFFFLRRTYFGKAIRAVSQNRNAAMLIGINPRHIFMVSFGLGTAFAAVAGSLITLTNPGITPQMGIDFLLKSFAIVVLGGLGNPVGALVGGLILGLTESVSALFVRFTATVAIAFMILILVLVLKPEGIFGSLR